MLGESDPPAIAAYRAALADAWRRGILPFTAAYGRELNVSPDAVHVEPWLEVADSAPAQTQGSAPPDCGLIGDATSPDTVERRRDRIHTLLDRHGHHGLVIIGDPGSGKSTLLRHLACAHRGPHIPILLPVTHLAAHLSAIGSGDIPDAAASYWTPRDAAELASLFATALEQGHALVLLDGLDEAGDRRQRQDIAAWVTAAMARWRTRGNQWLITSRPDGYRDAPLADPAITPATLCAWEKPQIEAALRGWCQALPTLEPGDTAPRHAASLRDRIDADEALRQLARNPLSLAMLVLLERMRGDLPTHRVRLYEAYAEELLHRREPQPAAHSLDPTEFLIPLALWFQQHHPIGRVHASLLAEQCEHIALQYEGYLRPEDAPPAVRDLAIARAHHFYTAGHTAAAGGILHESAPEHLAFSHRSLQDFFLGRALARMPSDRRWELLRPRLHAARWREPLLLCAGWLAVVERRREELDTLCNQILHAHSAHEPLLARDTRLAIAIATHSAGLIRHQRLAEMHEAMTRFSATFPSPMARYLWVDASAALARLGLGVAEKSLRTCLDAPFPALKEATLLTFEGKLDGESAKHLRDLAIGRLTSESPDERHTAWHVLLPRWHLDESVRTALIAALNGSNPPCRATAIELTRRALEGSSDGLPEWIRGYPWATPCLLDILAEEWKNFESSRPGLLRTLKQSASAAERLTLRLAEYAVDPLLRPEFEHLLRASDRRLRLHTLRALGTPRRGEPIAHFIRIALDDEDPEIRDVAQSIFKQLELHVPGGESRARSLLAGDREDRILAARNLSSKWWSDPELRPQILSLFSPADPDLAAIAFREGFSFLFTGQPELTAVAIVALESSHPELREAALTAVEPHLKRIPVFASTLLDILQRRAWPTLIHLAHALHRVVNERRDVRRCFGQIAAISMEPLALRDAALAGLEHLAHHDEETWRTVRAIVEAGNELDAWTIVYRAHGVLLHLGDLLPGEPLRRGLVLLDGQRVGTILETPTGTRFTYDPAWLAAPDALAISLTMPLRAEPYESEGLHPFFDNMLPEGWLLERVSLAEKIDKRDRLGILLATGSDAIGAVSIVPDDTPEPDE